MTTSAKQIAAYRLLNHLQLMPATESPPILLGEDKKVQNEPISVSGAPQPGEC